MSREQDERAALVALTLLRDAKEYGLTSAQLRASVDRGDLPSAVLAGAGERNGAEECLFPFVSACCGERARVRRGEIELPTAPNRPTV